MEKDRIIGESLSYFIKHEKHFEVFLALSKKEGDHLFKTMKFDAVFCGDCLPDGDGLEILREWIKQKPNLFSVLMTVKNDEQLRKEALESGIKGYLVKPFGLNDVEILLSHFV